MSQCGPQLLIAPTNVAMLIQAASLAACATSHLVDEAPGRPVGMVNFFYILFPAIQQERARIPILPIPGRAIFAAKRRFHRGRVMKPLTGPHAHGLISVPLRDSPASSGSEQRLAIETPHTASRSTGKAAVLAVVLIAIAASCAAIPVSYAIHRHMQP